MSHFTVWLLFPIEQRIKAFPEFSKIAGNYNILKNEWHCLRACPIEVLLSMKKYYLSTPKMTCSIFPTRHGFCSDFLR